MKNKKQFFGVLFSILISVFLVFVVVYAATTIGSDVSITDDLTITGNALTFANGASLSNNDSELLLITEDLVSIAGKASVSGAFYVGGTATFDGIASIGQMLFSSGLVTGDVLQAGGTTSVSYSRLGLGTVTTVWFLHRQIF